MRCEKCGTLVRGKTEKCPLCNAPLHNEGDVIFASPKKRSEKYNIPLTLIYIVIALSLTVICAVVNAFYFPSFSWWGITAIGFALIYYAVRHTLFGHRNFASKLAYLSVAVLLGAVSINQIVNSSIIYIYVLPCLLVCICSWSAIYVLCNFSRAKTCLLSVAVQGLLCCIPLCICACNSFIILPSAVIGGIGFCTATAFTAFAPKEMLNEIKRFFTA